jgi:small subunit ribosomal protein S6
MTRQYEAVYIFDSALDESAIDKHLDRFHALLKSKDNPEPIKNTNHWGKRTLAYPINGKEVGSYVVVQLATDPPLLPEFERLVKLEESAIRYQLVLNEGELPAAVPYPAPGSDDESRERPARPGSQKASADAPKAAAETADAPAEATDAPAAAPEATDAPAAAPEATDAPAAAEPDAPEAKEGDA